MTSAAPVATAGRKLAGLELAMRYTDDVAPFNVVAVVRIAGHLDPSKLRGALDEAQRHHPLLRARLVAEGKDHAFRFDGKKPIPLAVVEATGPETWIGAAEESLHERFDLAEGPLMRCRLLTAPLGDDLIVTLHHTITDAVSATRLLGDLLARCAGRTPDADDTTEEGKRSALELFPAEFKGARFAAATAGFMGRQTADEASYRWGSRGVRKAPIHAAGHCRILPVRFDAALTGAILARSRRDKVTVNAILSAALLTAVHRRLYPGRRAPLRHIVFADLRSRLGSPVADGVLGCFATMLRLTMTVEPDGDFWALARGIQDKTQAAARSGERFLQFALSPGLMKVILGVKAFRMSATALSYIGPTTLALEYGSFEVRGLHAFAANMTLGPEYSALARLFRGELWWDILYLDSDMDAAGARAIADDIETILGGVTR